MSKLILIFSLATLILSGIASTNAHPDRFEKRVISIRADVLGASIGYCFSNDTVAITCNTPADGQSTCSSDFKCQYSCKTGFCDTSNGNCEAADTIESCGTCDNRCTAPPSNGKAVCAKTEDESAAFNCEIQCDPGYWTPGDGYCYIICDGYKCYPPKGSETRCTDNECSWHCPNPWTTDDYTVDPKNSNSNGRCVYA